ncbi:MAG: heparan-alpha-glucosaminide N-acetyltransferase domain-containing protein [Gemmatimonadaceae bacterium]
MSATVAPDVRAAERADAASISSPVAPNAPARERLLSLDVFRGMTVASMLLVNNPGSWGAIYAPLEHAEWHGWTPTDLIFPFFLFIVGITTHLSLSARRSRGDPDGALARQVLKRGAIIYLLGLALNGFPYFDPQPGHAWASITSNFGISPVTHQPLVETIRLLGVLQRIAIAYVCGALLTLRTTARQQALLAVGILVGYWMLMTLVPVPGEGQTGALLLGDPARTLAAYVDRAALGHHIYNGTKLWDPEGILSTIPAIGTVLLGVFAGRWIGAPRPLIERVAGLFAAGSLAMVLGSIWGWAFPINKQLWTSSYVLFTAGMASVTIATCMWLIDVHGVKRWSAPFIPFGVNPMIAFVGSGLMARLIYTLWKVQNEEGRYIPVQSWIYRTGYASWLAEPKTASLLFAITFVVFWYAVLSYLNRRRIFFKV